MLKNHYVLVERRTKIKMEMNSKTILPFWDKYRLRFKGNKDCNKCYKGKVEGYSLSSSSYKGVEKVVGEPRLDHRVLLEPRVRWLGHINKADRGGEIHPLGFSAMVASQTIAEEPGVLLLAPPTFHQINMR